VPKGETRGRRAGPAADPTSGRSERRGFKLDALPHAGRSGNPPAFPLPRAERHEIVDGARVPSATQSKLYRAREIAIWREVWKTPQACVWEVDRWRWPTIALYCRLRTVAEAEPDASAALLSRLREVRIEIGLSPDGLRANGWAIAPPAEVTPPAPKSDTPTPIGAAPSRRLRAGG